MTRPAKRRVVRARGGDRTFGRAIATVPLHVLTICRLGPDESWHRWNAESRTIARDACRYQPDARAREDWEPVRGLPRWRFGLVVGALGRVSAAESFGVEHVPVCGAYPTLRCETSRTLRCWIPACAGMTGGHGPPGTPIAPGGASGYENPLCKGDAAAGRRPLNGGDSFGAAPSIGASQCSERSPLGRG